jgi:hypothetical protein
MLGLPPLNRVPPVPDGWLHLRFREITTMHYLCGIQSSILVFKPDLMKPKLDNPTNTGGLQCQFQLSFETFFKSAFHRI